MVWCALSSRLLPRVCVRVRVPARVCPGLSRQTNYSRRELYVLYIRFKALCAMSNSPYGIDRNTFRKGEASAFRRSLSLSLSVRMCVSLSLSFYVPPFFLCFANPKLLCVRACVCVCVCMWTCVHVCMRVYAFVIVLRVRRHFAVVCGGRPLRGSRVPLFGLRRLRPDRMGRVSISDSLWH